MSSNHKLDCNKDKFHFTGKGYNRSRECACGAVDHAPEEGCSLDVQAFLDEYDRMQDEDSVKKFSAGHL